MNSLSLRTPKSLFALVLGGPTLVLYTAKHLVRYGPMTLLRNLERIVSDEESWRGSISEHLRVARVMRSRHLRPVMRQYPQLKFRYLFPNLAASFPRMWRRQILLHHYQYLIPRVGEEFFERLMRGAVVLWSGTANGSSQEVRLVFSGKYTHDGDMTLTFAQNASVVYHVAFSIVPGFVVGSKESDVILVGRIQGVPACREAIKAATKACHDVSPPFVLMAAIHGIAQALGIPLIAGLRNAEQVCSDVTFDYDAFWAAFVGTVRGGFCHIDVPIPEKPLTDIARVHRRRTRVKRQLKSVIALNSCRGFRAAAHALRTDPSPSDASMDWQTHLSLE